MGHQLVISLVPSHDALSMQLGLAPSTEKRYRKACQSWITYCADRAIDPIHAPTSSITSWLDCRVRLFDSRSQINVSLAAAQMVQRVGAGDSDPLPYTRSARAALDQWVGARMRLLRGAEPARVTPILGPDLLRMLDTVRRQGPRRSVNWARAERISKRDACVLTLGWGGALRADEISRLEHRDVQVFPDRGIELLIRTSKSGSLERVALVAKPDCLAMCPVVAYSEYTFGKDFDSESRVLRLGAGHISTLVRRYARAAGLVGRFTAHSLRAGFATQCALSAVPDRLVQRHARWRSVETHAQYVRPVSLWAETPTALVRW